MHVAVVIPCFNVKRKIHSVLDGIGPEVNAIYVVDDKCPEKTGDYVEKTISDSRVKVIFNPRNTGVGGAVIAGYMRAMDDGADIVVKLDGDGQMDPSLIKRFIAPIVRGQADYTKGNRFFSIESLDGMPRIRLFGNAVLSFINKMISGYWNIMDPTNGYTAIHTSVLRILPLDKIDLRYFFESDMLFRLNTVRAVVQDIPMDAVYEDEKSGLDIRKVLMEFPGKQMLRFFKRIFYNYFLRDFNVCSIEIVLSTVFILFGTIFGIKEWMISISSGIPATTGTVIVAALPVILGFQMLIAAVHFDVMNVPVKTVHCSFASAEPEE